MPIEPIQPPSFKKPRGYSNGVLVRGPHDLLVVAGQIGWDAGERLVSDDFVAQFDRALANVLEVVRAAGGGPEHVVRLTMYATDKREYLDRLKEVGAAYRERMGRHFPAMALVEVSALVEDGAKIEIEATAALPRAAANEEP